MKKLMQRMLKAIMAGLLLTGCTSVSAAAEIVDSAKEEMPAETTVTETVKEDATEEEMAEDENPLLEKGSHRDGQKGIGYLSVPDGWKASHDLDDAKNMTLNWENEDGTISVSMYSFTKEELAEFGEEEVYEPEWWVLDDMETAKDEHSDADDQEEKVVEGKTMIGSYEGYTGSVYFDDSTTFTTIAFLDEEETMHIVTVETTDVETIGSVLDLIRLVMTTYNTFK